MSNETKVLRPVNKALEALGAKYNFKEAASGTKFWITQTSETVSDAIVTVFLSADKQGCYGRTEIAGKSIPVQLGINYQEILDMDDLTQEGLELVCDVAPRIPNPLLKEEDIDRVEQLPGRSKATGARIRAAIADPSASVELVMIAFEEPQIA